eukprot:Nitzschia sp. Nitz4//scaffold24_size164493//97462//98391//NITZ4_002334-RA/size164493-processed-gene-0.204-mRNA-1//1//CDS//3329544132//4643//frame0
MANKSIWADLPRRLATICIGFPLVWMMLSTPPLARVFFAGAHGWSLWEFTLLDPAAATGSQRWTQGKAGKSINMAFVLRVLYCVSSVAMAVALVSNDSLFHLCMMLQAGTWILLQQRHYALGLLLVTLPFRAWIRMAPNDFASTISVLLVVWNADTGALLAGRLASKLPIPRCPVPTWIHKISPAKSMEGYLGGVMGGTWTAVSWVPALIRWGWIQPSHHDGAWQALWGTFSYRLALGITLSLSAIAGDLVESSVKRQAHSKDSGSVLPGHGGILDRFDSSLLAVLLYEVVLETILQHEAKSRWSLQWW